MKMKNYDVCLAKVAFDFVLRLALRLWVFLMESQGVTYLI